MSALTNYQNGGQTFPTISTTMLGKIAAGLNPTDPQQWADRQRIRRLSAPSSTPTAPRQPR
jgi:hypothetical protein